MTGLSGIKLYPTLDFGHLVRLSAVRAVKLFYSQSGERLSIHFNLS